MRKLLFTLFALMVGLTASADLYYVSLKTAAGQDFPGIPEMNSQTSVKWTGAALGNTSFQIKVYNNDTKGEVWYNKTPNGAALQLGVATTLTNQFGSSISISGSEAGKAYDVEFNMTTNQVTVTASDAEVKPVTFAYGVHGNIFTGSWITKAMTQSGTNWVLSDVTVEEGEFGLKQYPEDSPNSQTAWYASSNENEITIVPGKTVTCAVDDANKGNFKIAGGTYTFTFDPENLQLTVTGTPSTGVTYPANMWVIGTIDGNGWNPLNVALMTNDGEGIYSIKSVTLGSVDGSCGFAVTASQATSDSDWDGVNGKRYGPSVKDTKAVIGTNDAKGTGGEATWSIDPGTYSMTFDYNTKVLTVAKAETTEPEPEPGDEEVLYLIGNIDGDQNWAYPGELMTDEGDGIWTVDVTLANDNGDGYAYFVIADNEYNSWDAAAGHLYGAASSNDEISVELNKETEIENVTKTGNSWKIENGIYHITFTTDENLLTVEKTGEYAAPEFTTLYIVGNVNGAEEWGTKNAMETTDGKTYTWTGTELSSGFKFTNGNWGNGDYNIGAQSDDTDVELGVAKKYFANTDSQNFTFDGFKVTDPSVVLNLEEGTLTVNGTEVPVETQWYIAGINNTWKLDENWELLPVDDSEEYAGVIEVTAETGVFQITTTNWGKKYGNNKLTITNENLSGNLAQIYNNENANYNLTAGNYNVTWNPNTLLVTFDMVAEPEEPGEATWNVVYAEQPFEMSGEGNELSVTVDLIGPQNFWFTKTVGTEAPVKYGPESETHLTEVSLLEGPYTIVENGNNFITNPNTGSAGTKMKFNLNTEDLSVSFEIVTDEPQPSYMKPATLIDPVLDENNEVPADKFTGYTLAVTYDYVALTAVSEDGWVTISVQNPEKTTVSVKGRPVPYFPGEYEDNGSTDIAPSVKVNDAVVSFPLSSVAMEATPPFGPILGEYTVTIPAGVVMDAEGNLNPEQVITFTVTEPTPAPDVMLGVSEDGVPTGPSEVYPLELNEETGLYEGTYTLEPGHTFNIWMKEGLQTYAMIGDVNYLAYGPASAEGVVFSNENNTLETTVTQNETGYWTLNNEGSCEINFAFNAQTLEFTAEAEYIPLAGAIGALEFEDWEMTFTANDENPKYIGVPINLVMEEGQDVPEYQGFQFDITLPSELEVSAVTLNSAFDGDVEFRPSKDYENTWLILADLNQINDEGYTDTEGLVTVTVKGIWDEDMEEGEHPVVIQNTVIFSTILGQEIDNISGYAGTVNYIILDEIVPATDITFDKVTLMEPSYTLEENDMVDTVVQGESVAMEITVTPEDTTDELTVTADNGATVTWDEENGVWVVNTDEVEVAEGETVTVTVTAKAGDVEKTYELTVKGVLLGDSNDNGNVNVADVTTTANYIASLDVQTFCFPNANVILTEVDGQQVINVQDLTATIDIIYGDFDGERNPAPKSVKGVRRMAPNSLTTDRLVTDNFKVSHGKPFQVGVNLDNRNSYAALQAVVAVPQGMKVLNVTAGPRAASHKLVYNITEDGNVNVVLYNLTNASFADGDGALFNLEVAADEDCGNIVIDKIYASDANSNGYNLIYDGGNNESWTTGVDGLDAEENGDVRYFTVDGVEIQNPEAGSIVIRVENGVASKVVVK